MPGGDSKSPTVTPATSLPVLKPACPPGSVTIAPRVLIKDESGPPAATGIVTQKEWVIPPRPKPGRKPATDTPPTKRKAQNRAAQRAFRERRAARVNELEDHLKKVESDAADRENSYRDQVSRITAENKLLRETVSELRRDLEQLRRLKEVNPTLTQVASPAPSSNTDQHVDALYDRNSSSWAKRTAKQPVPSRTSSQSSSSSRLIEIDDEEDFSSSPLSRPPGCCGGNSCRREGGECNASSFSNSCTSMIQMQKRPKSPNDPDSSKRPRFGPDLETDFTNTFMSSTRRTRSDAAVESASLMAENNISSDIMESCGFCTGDGATPCVCAEVAKMTREAEKDRGAEGLVELHKLPPIFPPRGGGDLVTESRGRDNGKLLPSHPPTRNEFVGCGSGSGAPGSCSTCKVDATCTLFCQALATRSRPSPVPAPSAPSSATTPTAEKDKMRIDNGSDKDAPRASGASITESSPSNEAPVGPRDRVPIYIPCSAAYQALSRHQRFEEASTADLGNLVGKLNTRDMQVEVSSVHDVLKYLDREFGKDTSKHKP